MTDTDETFDSPDNEDVLQTDEQPHYTIDDAIPVCVEGIVRTDEMPTRLGIFRNVLIQPGAEPIPIAPDNGRRKRLILFPGLQLDTELVLICIGITRDDAQAAQGAMLFSGASSVARYETTYSGQLWAKSWVANDVAGIFSNYTPATQSAILNIISEEWAR